MNRRELLSAAGGAVAAIAGGGLLREVVWPSFLHQDLLPGSPEAFTLSARAWGSADDATSFAAIGDHGSGGRQAVAVATSMAREYRRRPYGDVLMLGDITYYGRFDDRMEAVFTRPMRPLLDAGVTFDLALGNHDTGESELEVLGLPGRYYSKVLGPVGLFFLDTRTPASLGSPGEPQLAWLDDELAASAQRWKIVAMHHPLYSSGEHGSQLHLREVVGPVLRRHRVDLVLCGHDHHYERTLPIDGVTHVVSGGGCKPRPTGRSRFTAMAEAALEFVFIDVTGDRLTGEAIRPDGSVLDRFELRARSG